MNGSSGLASTPCSAFSSGRRRNRAASYEIPPGCREEFVWTYRQMITLISPGSHAVTCTKSESLMPNAARRSSSIRSRPDSRCDPRQFGNAHTQLRTPEIDDSLSRVRARLRRIGPLCSRGRLAVSQEPSHSLSGTEGAASRNHPMQAIDIKAESHDDTLILSIRIYSQNV